jgi:hypothetical protein
MRESQMKKIIALAVASAFAAPVMAADLTVSGSQEFGYMDVDGTTTSAMDATILVSASTETNNGIAVTAKVALSGEGANDGGSGVTMVGPFGTLALGDAPSAADAFDVAEYSKLVGIAGLGAPDAAISWTLPTVAEGVTLLVTNGADTNNSSSGENHTGVGVKYATGPVSVSYAKNDNEDDTTITVVAASATFGGVTVNVEQSEDGTSGATTEISAMGVKYVMGDITVYGQNQATENTSGTKTADVTAFGLHYNLGGGVTAFVEASSDDKNAALDSTGVGVVVAF